MVHCLLILGRGVHCVLLGEGLFNVGWFIVGNGLFGWFIVREGLLGGSLFIDRALLGGSLENEKICTKALQICCVFELICSHIFVPGAQFNSQRISN